MLIDWLLPQIARAERLSGELVEAKLVPFGLTYSQFRLMGHLLGETVGLTQKMLAQRMRLDPSAISVALRPLEQRGLVITERDNSDRRNVRVKLSVTDNTMQSVLKEIRQIEAELQAVLGDDSYRRLHGLLEKINGSLAQLLANSASEPERSKA